MGRREFLWRVKGLSEQSVFRAWLAEQAPEVEGHEAVSAVLAQL